MANVGDHTSGGNCWARAYSCTKNGCGRGELCDVCHKHDQPRGECDECPRCTACDEETDEHGE